LFLLKLTVTTHHFVTTHFAQFSGADDDGRQEKQKGENYAELEKRKKIQPERK